MMVVAADRALGSYQGMEQYSKAHTLIPHPLYNRSTNNADIMLIKVHCRILLPHSPTSSLSLCLQ